ncbi:lytic transglycosylase domain-containing protein [Paucibacter sp. PLA-PC-4]|uniref:lytic transglycosylase domain-containing protein n=1 Tax=Paucibacter sp. PLA-PC-4 TaxID=2993655 RepID=UPI00224B8594|nr:lytic transglycosylase domain-containing protein [Paucibacter sp. PLA-PC-4]MCX2864934.1 lytic transglycosylase domain-containing protein [Paucibacter sp. PLA-PC-4]
MDASTFLSLTLACAPQLHADTARALVSTESAFNPWAIGVVGARLTRQPRNRAEALATARALQASGWNYSVGLGQINRGNFARLGLTLDTAFDPCTNLSAMQTVLTECMARVPHLHRLPRTEQLALRQALSCYYSGNFVTGFKHGYVRRVARAMPGAPP